MAKKTEVQANEFGRGTGGTDALIDLSMIVLALAMTGVSGVTTFLGLINIVGGGANEGGVDGWLAHVLAFSLTAVVQIGLTILCWVIGRDTARSITAKRHETTAIKSKGAFYGKVTAVTILFVFCFAVSAFFSFNTYFNGLYGGKEEARVELRAVPSVALEISTLLRSAIADHRRESVAQIIETGQKSGYFGGMDTLVKSVSEAKGRINEKFKALNVARVEAEKKRLVELFKTKGIVESTLRTIEEKNARLAKIDKETVAQREGIPALESRIAELRADEAAALLEADKQFRGDDGRKAGKGKEYGAAIAAAKKAADAARALEGSIGDARKNIEVIATEKLNIETAIGIAKVDIGAANSDTGKRTDAGANESQEVAALADIDAAIAALSTARKIFGSTPVRENFEKVAGLCVDLRGAGIGDGQARTALEQINCTLGADVLDAMIASFTGQEARRADYEAACISMSNGTIDPAKAVELFRKCHELAVATGLPADGLKIEQAYQSVESYVSRFDRGQHAFLKTLQAFTVSPLLAGLAAFLAAIQDLSVLIMAFVVEFFRRERQYAREEELDRVLDDGQLDAVKLVLANCDPIPGEDAYSFELSPELTATMGADGLLQVKSVLEGLRARNLVSVIGRTSYKVASIGFAALDSKVRRTQKAARHAHTGAEPFAKSETIEGSRAPSELSSRYRSPAERAGDHFAARRNIRAANDAMPEALGKGYWQGGASVSKGRSRRLAAAGADMEHVSNNNPDGAIPEPAKASHRRLAAGDAPHPADGAESAPAREGEFGGAEGRGGTGRGVAPAGGKSREQLRRGKDIAGSLGPGVLQGGTETPEEAAESISEILSRFPPRSG